MHEVWGNYFSGVLWKPSDPFAWSITVYDRQATITSKFLMPQFGSCATWSIWQASHYHMQISHTTIRVPMQPGVYDRWGLMNCWQYLNSASRSSSPDYHPMNTTILHNILHPNLFITTLNAIICCQNHRHHPKMDTPSHGIQHQHNDAA